MPRNKAPGTALADPLADMLGYHLRRLSVRVMADLARALAPLDLNAAGAAVLLTINANPGVTQSEVGKAIGVLRANMAPLMAELSSRGWIDCEPVDGRSNALRISAKGAVVCRQVASLLKTHEERMFGSLPASARTRLIAQVRELWNENL